MWGLWTSSRKNCSSPRSWADTAIRIYSSSVSPSRNHGWLVSSSNRPALMIPSNPTIAPNRRASIGPSTNSRVFRVGSVKSTSRLTIRPIIPSTRCFCQVMLSASHGMVAIRRIKEESCSLSLQMVSRVCASCWVMPSANHGKLTILRAWKASSLAVLPMMPPI